MSEAEDYARIRQYEFVTNSSRFVCVGETNGSFNYALRDEVYPPDKKLIPIKNRFGGIDYHLNPNYKKK